MSAGRSGKSRAMAWTLSIIAVPVIYVLTLPPLVIFLGNHYASSEKVARFVASYVVPYNWLMAQKPIQRPLASYWHFWDDILSYPPPNP